MEGMGDLFAIMRCLSPTYIRFYYLGGCESNYIMSRNVEIWELLVE